MTARLLCSTFLLLCAFLQPAHSQIADDLGSRPEDALPRVWAAAHRHEHSDRDAQTILKAFPNDLRAYLLMTGEEQTLPPPYFSLDKALARLAEISSEKGIKFSPQDIALLLKFYADRGMPIGGYQRGKLIDIQEINVAEIDQILRLMGVRNKDLSGAGRTLSGLGSRGQMYIAGDGALSRYQAIDNQIEQWMNVVDHFDPDLRLLILARLSSVFVLTEHIRDKLFEVFASDLCLFAASDIDRATSIYFVYLNPRKSEGETSGSGKSQELTQTEYANRFLRLSADERKAFFTNGISPDELGRIRKQTRRKTFFDFLSDKKRAGLTSKNILEKLEKQPRAVLKALDSSPAIVVNILSGVTDSEFLTVGLKSPEAGTHEMIAQILERADVRSAMGENRATGLCRRLIEEAAKKLGQ